MMDSNQHSELTTRLELPRPEGDVSGVLSSTIIVSFAAIAFYNLANYQILPLYAIIFSVIWLLLVAAGLAFILSDFYEHGFRRFALDRLAPFSPHHFVEAPIPIDDDPIVRFGFSLLKWQFTQLQISKSDIASIEWSTGQATSWAGREMDDWHVCVWYHQKRARRRSETGYREEALHLVGRPGPRYQAEATGNSLVAFFESAGIVFDASSNECEFIAQHSQSAR